ncbi:MAG: peroxiredoxin [Sphingobium sp.]|nr:MAG: peroxiredoxin [Sphingobium sp.]
MLIRPLALVALASLSMLPSVAQAALAVGAKAPDFNTRGALAGKVMPVKLSDTLKKGPVVLYFFPAAFTKGCSAEAREFAENIDAFKKAGATVIGMSADPVDKLAKFSTADCASKFTVASAGPSIVKGYDVAMPPMPSMPDMPAGMTNRTSYVIAPTGRIAYVHSEMSYANHVKGTLAAVQALGAGK